MLCHGLRQYSHHISCIRNLQYP